MLEFERQAWDQGYRRVAGVDEVGRGPLAGPVVAAAVVFEPEFLEARHADLFAGLTDSKQLSSSERELFNVLLTQCPAVEIGLGMSEAEEIDEVNILRATHLAMVRAIQHLPSPPDHILVDGLFVPGFPCSSTPIVDGDSRSLSISAASVVAKVSRDSLMKELDRRYPEYGFAIHKGYGTKGHTQALLEHGPCPIHRRTFRPVRDIIRIRAWVEENGLAQKGWNGFRA